MHSTSAWMSLFPGCRRCAVGERMRPTVSVPRHAVADGSLGSLAAKGLGLWQSWSPSTRQYCVVPADEVFFCDEAAFDTWLQQHHESDGVWIRMAKSGSGIASLTSDEAVDVGLCWGWISGQRKAGCTVLSAALRPAPATQRLVAGQCRQGGTTHRDGPDAPARAAGSRGGKTRRPLGLSVSVSARFHRSRGSRRRATPTPRGRGRFSRAQPDGPVRRRAGGAAPGRRKPVRPASIRSCAGAAPNGPGPATARCAVRTAPTTASRSAIAPTVRWWCSTRRRRNLPRPQCGNTE